MAKIDRRVSDIFVKGIDPEDYAAFKAMCAYHGKTIKQAICDFIHEQAEAFREVKNMELED